MDKNYIMKRLMELPGEINAAEMGVIDEQKVLDTAKIALADKESALTLSGEINGKNAEQRAAQLREATKKERAAVAVAEFDVHVIKARLNLLHHEFKAMRSIATILSGEAV